MARARNIKPAFFANEDLAELDPYARLLFIGLWMQADREGRLEDRPKRIKAQVFPYDDCNISELLDGLSSFGFIKRYEAEGTRCIQINNWKKHQNPHHKEVESILPPDNGDTNLVCNGYIPLSGTIRNRIYDRDGKVCACCGSTDSLEIDHIVPVSKGGNSIDENLQVLCKRCNVKKFDKIINFKELRKHNPSIIQAWINNEVTLDQEQVNEIASCPTDSLNLIPDSLNLIPVEAKPQAQLSTEGFMLKDGSIWICPDEYLNACYRQFGKSMTDREFESARFWLTSNPAKRKTARGMTKFLGGWLDRATPDQPAVNESLSEVSMRTL